MRREAHSIRTAVTCPPMRKEDATARRPEAEGALSETGVPARKGVRDDGARLRQDQQHASQLPFQSEEFVESRLDAGNARFRCNREVRIGRGSPPAVRGAASSRHRLQHAAGDLAGRCPAGSGGVAPKLSRVAMSSSSSDMAGCSPIGWLRAPAIAWSRKAMDWRNPMSRCVRRMWLAGCVGSFAVNGSFVRQRHRRSPTRLAAALVRRSARAGRLLTRLYALPARADASSPAGAGSATTIAIGRVAVGIRTSDAAFARFSSIATPASSARAARPPTTSSTSSWPGSTIRRQTTTSACTRSAEPVAHGPRRFSRRVGPGRAAGTHPPVGQSVLDRLGAADRAHAGAGAARAASWCTRRAPFATARRSCSPASPAPARPRLRGSRRDDVARCSPTRSRTCARRPTATSPTARRSPGNWRAPGENMQAPLAAVYLLAAGPREPHRGRARGRGRARRAFATSCSSPRIPSWCTRCSGRSSRSSTRVPVRRLDVPARCARLGVRFE